MLDPVEFDRLALHQIDEAAGRRDDHVTGLFELGNLGGNVGTAVHRHGAQTLLVLGELLQLLRNLLPQLTRGGEYQGLHMVPLCVQMVEQRQAKRRSLARPRLGQPNEVTASLKQKWDGLGLDVGGRLEAHLGDGFQQGGREPEGVKGFQKQGDSRRKGRPFLSDGSAFRQRPSQRPSKCSSKRASLRSSHWWMYASSAVRSKAASQVRFSSSTASD